MANLDKYKESARKHELKEQWPRAIEFLVKAVEEFEKSPESDSDLALYNRVGDVYMKMNDTTNAIQYYERAVDRYTESGLVNPAIALCNKVLRLSPGRAAVYLKLGMLFAKKGFASEAKQNLLEYADRMQKAGQLEEAFKALKKFAEMTPGQQDEIWSVLAQQARAEAKTPEAREAVDKLLLEFEAKDKAAGQRRSRMSRSMVTGEEIPEETGPKKGELVFLDLDDMPAPGRKSGAPTVTAAVKPPPPPPPPPPPAPAPPLLEIETTSLAPEVEKPAPATPVADLPLLEIEPTSAAPPPLEFEPTSFEAAPPSLDLEPTSLEAAPPAPLEFEPTSLEIEPTSLDLGPAETDLELTAPGAESASLELEPTSLAEPPAEAPAAPSAGDLDLGAIELEPVGEEEPAAAAPTAGLPMLDMGEAPAEELPTESEVAQTLEFLDLGEVQAPAAPTVVDLEAEVAANGEDWAAHRRLAEALLEHGERERGLAELDASLAGYDLADSLPEAAALVEEILRLDSNSIRHQQKRVELAYRQGDRARLVDAYVELADALLRSNDPEKSIAVYQRVLEHDPDNARAKSALETLAPPAPPPAAAAARPAAPAAAPPPEGGYVDLGSFLLDEEEAPKDTRMRIEDEEPTGDEQKDFQQMLSAFKKGIESNVAEEDFESHYDLGVAYKEMGLLDEAIAEFQKALRSADGRLRSSEALGLCFFEKGQFAVAETIMRRALDLPARGDADRVGLLYWLGRTQEEQGKRGDALGSYNRVFAVDINFMDVNERVSALSKAGV